MSRLRNNIEVHKHRNGKNQSVYPVITSYCTVLRTSNPEAKQTVQPVHTCHINTPSMPKTQVKSQV